MLAVSLVELRERLQDHRNGDVARSRHRYHPLEIGKPPDVREFVEDEVDASGKTARMALQGDPAENIECLLHEEREYEVEGGIGIRHGAEESHLAPCVPHMVKLQLVETQKFLNLGDVKGLHAHVARDHDRFQGLPGGDLELLVACEREVVLGSYGGCHLDPLVIARPVIERPRRRVVFLRARLLHEPLPGLKLVK